jgi:hypothetical protein
MICAIRTGKRITEMLNPRVIFSKHISRKSDGDNTTTRLEESAAKGRISRRMVLDGFPWEGKFKTIDEINRYFHGGDIQCLLCGKTFRTLATHLVRIHGIDADHYKEKYSIPWTMGLSCSETTQNYRSVCNWRIENGDLDLNKLSLLRKSYKKQQRPQADCWKPRLRQQLYRGRKTLEKLGGEYLAKYKDSDYEKFLSIYESTDTSLFEIGKKDGLPCSHSVKLYRSKNPDYDRRFNRVLINKKRVAFYDGLTKRDRRKKQRRINRIAKMVTSA